MSGFEPIEFTEVPENNILSTVTTTITYSEKSNSKAHAARESPEDFIESSDLPYWLVNVPRNEWPEECPEYLRDVPQKSIRCLSTPDDQYRRQNWDVAKEIVATNKIDQFQRVPSDLRKYLEYTAMIKAGYGSILDYVVKNRLQWEDSLEPKGSTPFENPDDYKILYNDWPYGVEQDIIHLVVWTKFKFEDDPVTGDISSQSRKEIAEYVAKEFEPHMPTEQIIWFRNWSSLKSVHAVEHFHVMLYQPDMEFVRGITNGDVPLVDKAALNTDETLDGRRGSHIYID